MSQTAAHITAGAKKEDVRQRPYRATKKMDEYAEANNEASLFRLMSRLDDLCETSAINERDYLELSRVLKNSHELFELATKFKTEYTKRVGLLDARDRRAVKKVNDEVAIGNVLREKIRILEQKAKVEESLTKIQADNYELELSNSRLKIENADLRAETAVKKLETTEVKLKAADQMLREFISDATAAVSHSKKRIKN